MLPQYTVLAISSLRARIAGSSTIPGYAKGIAPAAGITPAAGINCMGAAPIIPGCPNCIIDVAATAAWGIIMGATPGIITASVLGCWCGCGGVSSPPDEKTSCTGGCCCCSVPGAGGVSLSAVGIFLVRGFIFFFSFSCRNNTEIGSTAEKKRSKSYIARQESVSLLHEPFFLLLYFVCRKRVPLPKIKTTKPFWLTCALVAEKRWRLPLHDTTYIPELQHVTYLSLHRLGQR